MKISSTSCSLLTTIALAVPALNAATVITPVSAIATSSQSGGNRNLTKTIDGSGLSDVSDPLSELDDVHPYISATDSPYWLSSGAVSSEVMEFDLGGGTAFDIAGAYHWKYTRDASRNIRTFDISFSTDGGSDGGNTWSTPVSAASLNMSDWSQSLGTREDSFAELRTFDTLSGITDIRFSNITVYGGSLVGLHEIRFVEAIPEPSTSLFGGLGAMLLLHRRRK